MLQNNVLYGGNSIIADIENYTHNNHNTIYNHYKYQTDNKGVNKWKLIKGNCQKYIKS